MSLITRKITAFAKKITDLADRPGGTLTPAQLKVQFDSSPEELRVAHNGLVDDLSSTAVGASGAHQISSETISGVTGNNVHAQLSSLKTQVNESALGQIPDASVTPAKLSFSPAITGSDVLSRLITVDGTGSGLDADKVDGIDLRITNGLLEFNDGTGWKVVADNRVAVASDTVQLSFPTEYTGTLGNSNANPLLVAKFTPKTTGEFLLKFEGKYTGTGTAVLLFFSTSAGIPADQFAASKSNLLIDYRTALGTTLATYTASHGTSTGMGVPASTANYTALTTLLTVHRLEPIYLVLSHSNASGAGVVGFKNLTVCYDLL